MKDTDLLQLALGLSAPWQVSKVEFDPSKSQLTLMIDFPKGSRFACPACGQVDCKAYDTEQKTWRHLNFFQHEIFITARVPRTDCSRCGPRLISAPWARSGSGFTLLFEALVMILSQQMPINSLAQLIGEHDTRLGRVLHHCVHSARHEVNLSNVVRVGVDETSKSRRHDYVSLFCGPGERRVIFATPGKDASTLERFSQVFRFITAIPSQLRKSVATCPRPSSKVCSSSFPMHGSPLTISRHKDHQRGRGRSPPPRTNATP
jgi:transposase